VIDRKLPIDFSTVAFYGQGTNQRKTMKTWEKTREQNLVRHKSGRYYAHIQQQ
jgi:hypothetical protein